jgi:hypothetical protein
MPTCWECGNETPATMTATLRLASGARRQFELCPACYRDHYLPLLAEAAGPGSDPAGPPRRAPRRGSTRPNGR